MANESRVRFAWFCPSKGDADSASSATRWPLKGMQHLVDVAKAAEHANFDNILVPSCMGCYDPSCVSSVLLRETDRIKIVTAVRAMGSTPLASARTIATLAQQAPGRVAAKLVPGNRAEAQADGILIDPTIADSYLGNFAETFAKLLLTGSAEIEDTLSESRSIYIGVTDADYIAPELFLGSNTAEGLSLAAANYDGYITFGHSPHKLKSHFASAAELERHRRTSLTFGVGLDIIARETREEAISAAERAIALGDPEMKHQMQVAYARSSKVLDWTIEDLRKANYWINPYLWLGLAELRFGQVVTVVGSYDEVARGLNEFIEAGISYFSFTGHPFISEATRIGNEIIPRVRELSNR